MRNPYPKEEQTMESNQILCGDANHLLRELAEASVDLVITDPPYLCRYKDRDGRTLANDDNPQGVLPVFNEA